MVCTRITEEEMNQLTCYPLTKTLSRNIEVLKADKETIKALRHKRVLVSVDYENEKVSEDLEMYREWAVVTYVGKDGVHVKPYMLTKEWKRKTRLYKGLSGREISNYYADNEYPEYCRRLAENEVEDMTI